MVHEKKVHSIILFDGVCNLCNNSINFVIRHDPKDYFRFCALQTTTGQLLLKKYNIDPKETDSIILIENESAYTKATAALKIAKKLDKAWPLLYGFIITPAFIRNIVYDFIARNRYKWYGKKEHCMVPTPKLKAKFL